MEEDILFKIHRSVHRLRDIKDSVQKTAGVYQKSLNNVEDTMVGLLEEMALLLIEVRDLKKFVDSKGK